MRCILLRPLRETTDGFTFIELVVTLVVLAIVSLIGYRVVEPMINGFVFARDSAVIYSDGKYALDKIVMDIRNSIPNTVRISPSGDAVEFAEMEGSGYYAPVSGLDNITCVGIAPSKGSKVVIYAVRSDWFYDGDSVYAVNKYIPKEKRCILSRAINRGSPFNRIYLIKDIVIYYYRDGVIYKNTISLAQSDWKSAESGGQPLVDHVKSVKFSLSGGFAYSMPEVVFNMVIAYGGNKFEFFGTARVRNVP